MSESPEILVLERFKIAQMDLEHADRAMELFFSPLLEAAGKIGPEAVKEALARVPESSARFRLWQKYRNTQPTEEPKTRSGGEAVRLQHSVARFRTTLDSVDTALSLKGRVGTDLAQTVLISASEVAMQIAKHDSFSLYEEDARQRAKERPKACGQQYWDNGLGMAGDWATCSESRPCDKCGPRISRWNEANKRTAF